MKKGNTCKVVSLFFVSWIFSALTFAGEIDILVQKLVEKGVLSHGQAQQIITETKEEIRKENAKGTNESLPKWLQNMKLKGDLRARYQWEDKTNTEDRHRGRYRFRLGVEGKVNDKLTVAAGLATGADDARSTNQEMTGAFSSKDIKLDYAFAEYLAAPWATLKMGKIASIKDVLFRPSDLLWDSDINPEGLTVQLTKKVNDNLELFMNDSIWVLDESSSDTSDPFMLAFQPGFNYKISENVNLKAGIAGYIFENVKGSSINNGKDTTGSYNTTSGGNLVYNYNSISPSLELGINEPFGGLVPYLGFFGDYVYNPDPGTNNKGYLFGLKFGAKKIVNAGDWQTQYMYRKLEKDAWLDIFPDSDFYGGHTDVKGHEIIFEYGLSKNTSIGLDYYSTERIGADSQAHVLQLDWMMKF